MHSIPCTTRHWSILQRQCAVKLCLPPEYESIVSGSSWINEKKDMKIQKKNITLSKILYIKLNILCPLNIKCMQQQWANGLIISINTAMPGLMFMYVSFFILPGIISWILPEIFFVWGWIYSLYELNFHQYPWRINMGWFGYYKCHRSIAISAVCRFQMPNSVNSVLSIFVKWKWRCAMNTIQGWF